jgi:hypothetical protein
MGEAKWRRIVEQAFEAVHETLWTTIAPGAAEDLDEMARQAPSRHPGSPIPAVE